MKTAQLIRRSAALFAALALSPYATAQTTITTTTADRPAVVATTGERVVTTTRVGRVGTVSPDTLMMDASAGTEPVSYIRTARTVYVDETGAPVPVETIRAGVPVTVHYTQDADRYLADRVVVHRRTVVNPAPVIERSTTVEPGVVERSTVVEPARRPALIQKKTTTTTTTKEPGRVIVRDDDDDDDDDD